jgi:uncharacterized coiled-coil protein SlyX
VCLIWFEFACFGLVPSVQAVSPAPDGGYPGQNTAEGQNALLSLTTGVNNTAIGWLSLKSLTIHNNNTAIGAAALLHNTADGNTATGSGALSRNTSGYQNTADGAFALSQNNGHANTATGFQALFSNTTGIENTAVGYLSLVSNITGSANTGVGWEALHNNTAGDDNTAIGSQALQNTVGAGNTAIGNGALFNLTSGNNNIALGAGAGSNIKLSNNVICIGTFAAGADVAGTCFISNIRGVPTQSPDAIPVLIDSAGQLGTLNSSRRYKTDIKPMDKASESILALKPVSFRYKVYKNTTRQFGLIAEEVAETNPDLVIYDADGRPYTVRYDAVNAMLLNEFLKEHRTVEEQECRILEQEATITQLKHDLHATAARQQKQIEALTEGLQKVNAQLEASKPAPQVVNNP